ncbi:hypothetical protein I6F65_11455 [Pseudoalteromonas sp. SWXJZ94C]|uniref:hypothetical protein n=1 Tax=unclassified Pseudoalteromonas TaxID=194690 RepID=UPI0004630FD7|nr:MULTISPECIES: hypothetical protein [unclassified Pseudoalteromonas]MBH0057579.1 hypothetical protein [Pseudoalteromonas sp. SWXJZ94C]
MSSNPAFELKVKRLFPKSVLQEMYASLDSDPELRQAGVIFEAEKDNISKLSVNPAMLLINPNSNYDQKVLRVSCRADKKVIYIKEFVLPKQMKAQDKVDKINSSIWKESKNSMISCAGAASGWVLILVETGGGAVTVGATWAAIPLTLTSTAASTFQCGVSLGRVFNSLNGNEEYNQWLDSSPIFSTLMVTLDVIQVADLTKAGLDAGSLLIKFKQNKALGQNKLLKMYQGMTRENRKKLAVEILKLNNPRLVKNQKLLKQVIRGQTLLDDGTKATKVYTQAQVQRLIRSSFYKAFLTQKSLATGAGTAATMYGSVNGLHNKVSNSATYMIGITTE